MACPARETGSSTIEIKSEILLLSFVFTFANVYICKSGHPPGLNHFVGSVVQVDSWKYVDDIVP